MKRSLYFIIGVLGAAVLFGSCNKMEYYQNNPNASSVATPPQLLTHIGVNVFKLHSQPNMAYVCRYLTYYGREVPWNTYAFEAETFSAYDLLRQVNKMQQIAQGSDGTAYVAIGKFFRAYLFLYETDCLGDIPYSQALDPVAYPKPEYDSQKEVYLGVLDELAEANEMLASTDEAIGGDVIFGGSLLQWRKAINSLSLRALIHLSHRTDDAGLQVEERFDEIVSDPQKFPLMESNADNFQLVYNTTSDSNNYPYYQYVDFTGAVSMEQNIVEMMKRCEDPRLFKIAAPVAGLPADDFDSYVGIHAGLPLSEQMSLSTSASRIAPRYYDNRTNEPFVLLGYSEQEFVIAEAMVRNWTPGGVASAKTHYNNAILASMDYYGVDGASAQAYVGNAGVDLATVADPLTAIYEQKYLSMFFNYGSEPFFEQRRTGVPTFNVGASTANNGQVPVRWLYPQSEYENNAANVEAAVASQFGAAETINSRIWTIK